MHTTPLAYFITFTTYGSWLHGDKRNSVIRHANGTKLLNSNRYLENYHKFRMKYPAVLLNSKQREIVLESVIDHCRVRSWKLWAVHIQDNHVHVIISAKVPVEKVMAQLKAWATRKLRKNGFDMSRVWTRHGSTRYLKTTAVLKQKIRYVIYEQNKMMQYYIDESAL